MQALSPRALAVLRVALVAAALVIVTAAPAATAPRSGSTAISLPGIGPTATPAAAVRALVDQRPWLVDGARSADLVVTSVSPGAGTASSIVRLGEEIDGVPVLGGEVVAAVDRSRRIVAVSAASLPGAAPSLQPRLSADQARRIAIEALTKTLGAGLVASEPSLAIYDPRLLGVPGLQRAVLVWDVAVTRADAVRRRVLVDAEVGVVALVLEGAMSSRDRVVCDEDGLVPTGSCSRAGTGAGSWSHRRAEGEAASGISDVDDAYAYSGATYDFYAGLGRDGIDNLGMTLLSSVRICDRPDCGSYGNAYWDGSAMFYGAGFARADDVVGHELTHGVTQYESGLFYYAQAGALNEGLSDVFGEFVDLANPGSGATADTDANRWQMGEDLTAIGPLRDMKNPPRFGDPDSTASTLYYGGAGDHSGVHTNSGVVNKTAYLIADGAAFNGQVVTGIGLAKSAWIWYAAALLLRSGGQFTDLDVALRQGCATLIGSHSIVTADCDEVAKATLATGLATPPVNALVAQAPVCDTGSPTSTLFSDGFESPAPGAWTAERLVGTDGGWDPLSPEYPGAGAQSLSGIDPATPSDTTHTTAAAITLPGTAYLRFRHAYSFESSSGVNYDGGVVEYSSDGGPWTDIGGLTADNGYSGALYDAGSNPLRGRAAFVANTLGYTATRVDLSTLAGHSVRFRFRIGTDTGGDSYGWFVDDVTVYACTPPAAALPVADAPVEAAPLPVAPVLRTTTPRLVAGAIATTIVAAGPGRASIGVTLLVRGRTSVACRSTLEIKSAGSVRVSCRLSSRAKRLLRTTQAVASVRTTFTLADGTTSVSVKTITLKRVRR